MSTLQDRPIVTQISSDQIQTQRDKIEEELLGPSDNFEGVFSSNATDSSILISLRQANKMEQLANDCFIAPPPHRGAQFVKRFELLLLLVGGLAPAIAVTSLVGKASLFGPFASTVFAVAAAIIVAWYILSRLSDYANARQLSYVLPVNALVFLAALAVMALLRIPYSSVFFASAVPASIATSFLSAVYRRRIIKSHLVVLAGRSSEIMLGGQFLPAPPFADIDHLIDNGRRDWALVADLHYPHSECGERVFAKAALAGVPVYHFRQIAEMQSGQVRISHLSENDLGSLIPNASYTSIKRLLDILGALMLVPLCMPLLIFLALLIKFDSPGSPIFIQNRMGFRGQTFRMIKFRTMRERSALTDEAARRDDAMTKSDDDRITRIGRFLRKTRIDELPQMFNVLRGEMSFIGPRPEACTLSEWYDSEIPFYCYRHIVRPGITGWAQVNQGHVTEVSDVLSKLRYDFYYIKNVSLWLDVLITLKTFRVIVGGIGAK